MTTDQGAVEALLRLALMLCLITPIVIASCAGADGYRRGDTLDVSTYPPDMQRAYEVFAVHCSRCHTLARPLNARIDDEQHWVHYVDRMRRNPASGINAKNGQVILRFLLYYMKHRTAPEHGSAAGGGLSADTGAASSGQALVSTSEMKP